MPAAWDADESTEPAWSDPDAWRGVVHSELTWSPDPGTVWNSALDAEPFILEEDLLEDESDWCPGGWLEDWGEEGDR